MQLGRAAALLLAAMAWTAGRCLAREPESTAPPVVLWAWQRAEDLRGIDPKQCGVAYMAAHVMLSGDKVETHWRDQPIKMPPRTWVMPVVRIDTEHRRQPPALDDEQLDATVEVLCRANAASRTNRLQIDFDARASERAFYRQLMERLRRRLPAGTWVSITALASWCMFDRWLDQLASDETVPMMFTLGRERDRVLLYFRRHHDFLDAGCCHSLGVSLEDKEMNELMIPLAQQRKIPVRFYVFTRTAWTQEKLLRMRRLLGLN